MSDIPEIRGKRIILKKIMVSDIDDRFAIGKHHEFIHMCGGETLLEPEYPERETWVKWYNSNKDADYSWIIDFLRCRTGEA